MSEQFYTILTSIGQAKIANSGVLGTKVNFVKFKVGDGGGGYYNPTEAQTDVKNKVWEGNISSISVDESNSNWIVIETVIPTLDGGFTIREAGIFDDENNLIAIGKYPETYKPVAAEGSSKDLLIRMILEVSNAENVNLKVDPTVILATKKDIQTLESKIQVINTQLSDMVQSTNILTPINGSTANAILLNIPTLTNNKKYSFKATTLSTGNVTINGKAFKKDTTTQIGSGGVKANKVYDFYYDSTSDCVFILAKAEGDSTDANVLAGKIYSNGDDVGRVGTMPNRAGDTSCISSSVNGTTLKLMASEGYRDGVDDNVTITDADFIASNIVGGKNVFGLDGSATIESLGGRQYATGTINHVKGTTEIIILPFTASCIIIPYDYHYVWTYKNGRTNFVMLYSSDANYAGAFVSTTGANILVDNTLATGLITWQAWK